MKEKELKYWQTFFENGDMNYLITESQVETVRKKSITKVLDRSERAILGACDKSAKS